jgi:hypothetical protein
MLTIIYRLGTVFDRGVVVPCLSTRLDHGFTCDSVTAGQDRCRLCASILANSIELGVQRGRSHDRRL